MSIHQLLQKSGLLKVKILVKPKSVQYWPRPVIVLKKLAVKSYNAPLIFFLFSLGGLATIFYFCDPFGEVAQLVRASDS